MCMEVVDHIQLGGLQNQISLLVTHLRCIKLMNNYVRINNKKLKYVQNTYGKLEAVSVSGDVSQFPTKRTTNL